ncbi:MULTISPECIES: glycosyltransferase family 87 protein [unclassified Corynebacterium]|uniref:glycosyltransferase family 87 protein n=1 Tax=unclassified Corynebacterium TaxID=2624378 RepID=UPI0029C9D837|nr:MULTISPECIES: glycosyltransferase family 87 protein [unclassified Corynebacterium]WPF65806.1 glycosyltransferase family 87 protein [Corynebacterium sp. 22KM0430]WPF68299.1 glycosyltransferase family 87 protein [Corynebacterium sp. 21KM1197]
MPRRSLHRTRVFSPATLVFALLFGVANAAIWFHRQSTDDWASLWIAGEMVVRGDTHLLYDIWEKDFSRWTERVWLAYVEDNPNYNFPHPFVHIPLVAWFTSLLTQIMSYGTSEVLLTFAQGFCLVTLVASAYTLWFKRPMRLPHLAAATAVLWLTAAFQLSSSIGQTTPLILAAIAYGLAMAAHRPLLSGFVLGIAAAIKLTPLSLLVPLIIFRGTRRAALVTAATAASIVLLSLLLAGPDVFQEWMSTLSWLNSSGIVDTVNQSFTSVLLEPTTETTMQMGKRTEELHVPIVADIPLWITAISRGATIVGLIGVCWAALRNRERAFEILSVGGFTLATLTAGIMWTHYLIIVALPIMGTLALTPRHRIKVVYPALALFTALLLPPFAQESPFYVPWLGLVSLSLHLILFLVVVGAPRTRRNAPRAARRRRKTPPAAAIPTPDSQQIDKDRLVA